MGLFGNDPLGPPLFNGGPFRGKPFVPAGGGGGGGGGGGSEFTGYFGARLSANQTSNVAVGQHVEFDLSDTTGIATLATGAGQADGLITINETGDYYAYYCLQGRTTGFLTFRLFFHPSNAPVLDRAGINMSVTMMGRQSTDTSPAGNISSIVSLTAGDVIKVGVVSNVGTFSFIHFQFSSLVLLKVS